MSHASQATPPAPPLDADSSLHTPAADFLRGYAIVAAPLSLLFGACVALFFLVSPTLGTLLLLGLAGALALHVALRWPIALVGLLWAVGPVNYGFRVPGAVITLSSLVALLMLVVIVIRLGLGDVERVRRLRAAFPAVAALLTVVGMAILTAIPHPNAFNVRYEVFNAIALLYALLFFERRHWRLLFFLFCGTLLLESVLALGLKFALGFTGASFFDTNGGVRLIRFTEEDLVGYGGGRFRLSGTLGHKNLLAGYLVMMLPLVGLMLLRYLRPALLLVLVPALVTLALTDSMTGWGGLVLAGVLALLLIRRVDSLAILLLLLFPIGVLALMRFGEPILFRIDQLLTDEQGWTTVTSRGQLLQIALELIERHAWLGTGRNNFMLYGSTYYPHAHNLILQKLLEMGIPGGLMFLGTFFTLWALPLRMLIVDRLRLAEAGLYYPILGTWLGCTGYLAMGMLDYNYQHFTLAPMFMTLLGAMLSETLRPASGRLLH